MRAAAYGQPMQPAQSVPASIERRVFSAWTIAIPSSFSETFFADDGYWHAWDEHRSVSLSSLVLTEESCPAPAESIVQQFPRLDGSPLDMLPAGLLGRAAEAQAVQPARASRSLSGLLAADGRVLIVTIVSDDVEWARTTWQSIRYLDAPACDSYS
jgi:hypothetical protein